MSTPSLFPEDPRIELHITLDRSREQITFDGRPKQTGKNWRTGPCGWVTDYSDGESRGKPKIWKGKMNPAIDISIRFTFWDRVI